MHEIGHARARGDSQAPVSSFRVLALLDAFGQLVVFFKGGGREDGVDEVCQLLEISFVVDLAAVGLRDENADEVPGQFGRCYVGSPLGYAINPRVDDEGCALVLEIVSASDARMLQRDTHVAVIELPEALPSQRWRVT